MAPALSSLPTANIQAKFSLTLLGLFLVGCVVVCVIGGIARLLRPHTNAPRRSSFLAAGFGTAMLVGGFLFFLFLTVFSTRQVEAPALPVAAEYDVNTFDDATYIAANSQHATDSSKVEPEPQTVAHVHDDSKTLWLPITQEALDGLANDEQAQEIRDLLSKIPNELSHAYALIPLARTGPAAAPPVIRQVLNPAAIRYLLTPGRVQTFSAALTAMLEADVDTDSAAEGADIPVELETPPPETAKVADWVNQKPGIGQTVVSSKFTESTTPAEEALRPAIVEALQNRISKLCSQEFGIDERWQQLVDVSISDRCVRQCIVKTDQKVEVLDTVDGRKMMQQTYALIEFPEAIEQQALEAIRTELIKSRTVAVCITLIAVWLCGLLLAFAFQASQRGSFLRKLATVPAMVILCLPCLLVAIAMISAMANGDSFELNWGKSRVACVVDNAAD